MIPTPGPDYEEAGFEGIWREKDLEGEGFEARGKENE
jgi:hypothetical protein